MLYCRADKLAGGMDETKRRGSTRYIALNNREYLSKGSLLLRWPAEASEALDTTERVQDFLCWPSKLIFHRRWNQYLVKKKINVDSKVIYFIYCEFNCTDLKLWYGVSYCRPGRCLQNENIWNDGRTLFIALLETSFVY